MLDIIRVKSKTQNLDELADKLTTQLANVVWIPSGEGKRLRVYQLIRLALQQVRDEKE